MKEAAEILELVKPRLNEPLMNWSKKGSLSLWSPATGIRAAPMTGD